ncbi:MAG: XdhC family protein [Planctomycetes bacterium]|nr:XdhC family protein [Planctomycetota bacterium]
MYEIFKEILHLAEINEPCVLATVVRTKGSTPQKEGAKMLIRKDGSCVGTLGGGCIEGEIWSQAKDIFKNHSGAALRVYNLNEEFASRDGMVCGGAISIFIDLLTEPYAFGSYAREILCAYEGHTSLSLATIINSNEGKTSLGTKFLVRENGATQGNIHNEKLEREIVDVFKKMAFNEENKIFRSDDGTEVYIERFQARPILILIGGGHVNSAVSKIASLMDFNIYIVDDRPEYLQKERFPDAKAMVISDYRKSLENIPATQNSYIVVATRGHRYDDLALFAAIQTQARYIGLLGSKRKSLEIFKSLLKENVSWGKIKKIHAPIGLNIKAITPEEIAVSIMAEIIMVRYGGEGGQLKMQESKLNALFLKSEMKPDHHKSLH